MSISDHSLISGGYGHIQKGKNQSGFVTGIE